MVNIDYATDAKRYTFMRQTRNGTHLCDRRCPWQASNLIEHSSSTLKLEQTSGALKRQKQTKLIEQSSSALKRQKQNKREPDSVSVGKLLS